MVAAAPDLFRLIEGAFRDAWPLMKSRMKVYWILAGICAIASLPAILAYFTPNAQDAWQIRIQMAIQPADALGAIAVFFVMPAVARTVRPEFAMTFGLILAVFGIGLIVGVLAEIGIFLLILPGVWIMVKWYLATWCYLLSDGKNPFGESWEITTGHFWETFGFAILLSMLVTAGLLVGFFLPVAIAILVPALAVVLCPLAFFAFVFAYHVTFLAQMRWMLALRG
ncbi:MAG: hypothetical protein WAK16_02725 [Candidatus Cybelea sp.]